jgi:hypothetical protein
MEMVRVARKNDHRPDGTLEASGLLDPKRLMVGDVKYRLTGEQNPPVPEWKQRYLRRPFWWVINRIIAIKHYLKF